MSAVAQRTVNRSASSSTISAAVSRVPSRIDEKTSIEQEKQNVQSDVDNVDSELQYGEAPDGGLRAWLAITGVRFHLVPSYILLFSEPLYSVRPALAPRLV